MNSVHWAVPGQGSSGSLVWRVSLILSDNSASIALSPYGIRLGVRIEGAGARPNLDAPPGASFPTASWQLKTDEAKYRFVLLLFGKNRLISLYPPDTPAHSVGSIGPVFPVHPVLQPLFLRGRQYQVPSAHCKDAC